MPDLETVGEQSAEVTVEAATSSEPHYTTPAAESPALEFPASAPESPAPDQIPDSPALTRTPDSPAPVPRPIPYPEIEIVVVKTSRKTSEVRNTFFSETNSFKWMSNNISLINLKYVSHGVENQVDFDWNQFTSSPFSKKNNNQIGRSY